MDKSKKHVDTGTLVCTFVLSVSAGLLYLKVDKGAPLTWWQVLSPIWCYIALIAFLMAALKTIRYFRYRADRKRMLKLQQAVLNLQIIKLQIEQRLERLHELEALNDKSLQDLKHDVGVFIDGIIDNINSVT